MVGGFNQGSEFLRLPPWPQPGSTPQSPAPTPRWSVSLLLCLSLQRKTSLVMSNVHSQIGVSRPAASSPGNVGPDDPRHPFQPGTLNLNLQLKKKKIKTTGRAADVPQPRLQTSAHFPLAGRARALCPFKSVSLANDTKHRAALAAAARRRQIQGAGN